MKSITEDTEWHDEEKKRNIFAPKNTERLQKQLIYVNMQKVHKRWNEMQISCM